MRGLLLTFAPVKRIRVWLIVVLAMLLPVRGALAAAMPCASLGAHGGAAHAAHGAAGHADAAHANAGHAQGAHDAHDDPGGTESCLLCTACCATALVRVVVGVAEPGAAKLDFVEPAAAGPNFTPDREERPPRSI